jgi:hypothetical protein
MRRSRIRMTGASNCTNVAGGANIHVQTVRIPVQPLPRSVVLTGWLAPGGACGSSDVCLVATAIN